MKYLIAGLCTMSLAGAVAANNTGFDFPPAINAVATNVVVTGTETDGGTGDCSFVTINITADIEGINDLDGGNDQVRFSVFDDGAERDFTVVSVPVGSTETINVTLTFEGLVGVGALGVGVIIFDGPSADFNNELFNLDPFEPDVISGSCEGAGQSLPVPMDSPWMLTLLAALLILVAMGVIRARGRA